MVQTRSRAGNTTSELPPAKKRNLAKVSKKESVNESTDLSAKESMNESVNQSFNASFKQVVNESFSETTTSSANESVSTASNGSAKEPSAIQSSASSSQSVVLGSINQPTNRSVGSSVEWLSCAFLFPLVIAFLNDGDVVARLLLSCNVMRRMINKYTLKKEYYDNDALTVLQASRDVQFSVSCLIVGSRDTLAQIEQLNKAPLTRVSYEWRRRSEINDAPPPTCVTHLKCLFFGPDYDGFVITPGWIPDNVTEMVLTGNRVTSGSFPASLRTLTWCVELNEFNPAVIPSSLTTLTLSEAERGPQGASRGPLCLPFPASLASLNLEEYNQTLAVGILPPSLRTLMCSGDLLSKLEPGAIPDSLTRLDVEWVEHCVPAPGVMPNSLTQLDIRTSCHDISDLSSWTFPTSVTDLGLDISAKISAGMIPATVTHLRLDRVPGGMDVRAIPNSVTNLTLNSSFGIPRGTIPSSVTHLRIIDYLADYCILPGDIPSSVTHLHFSCNRNSREQKLVPGIIPESVRYLCFDQYFNRPIREGFIPASVTQLVFGDNFNQPVAQATFPPGLTHLLFGRNFNKPVKPSVLPSSLTHLVFGDYFKHKLLSGAIPNSVTYLAFGHDNPYYGFLHELDETNLPSSLTHLEIPRGYLKQHDKLWLPPGVTHISYKAKSVDQRPEFAQCSGIW